VTYYDGKDLARSFRVVRRNTLIAAEEIPEDQYGFKPAATVRSVAELLAHIAVSGRAMYDTHAVEHLQTFVGIDFPARLRLRAEQERQLTTKPVLLAALREDGERWARFLEGVSEAVLSEIVTYPPTMDPPSKCRFELLLAAKEHEMHHRAQLMVYQRLLGLVPHLTREREARMGR